VGDAPGSRRRDGERAPATYRAQLRAPHVAEIVAEELRRRILDGEIPDGDLLPKQEDLHDEFQVSRPSLREALRILEAEGLISVRRGKVGGAIVHRPRAENAAYSLGLILRSRSVPVDDVSDALRHIEPVCAALCAARSDRHTEVVPRLAAIQKAAADCIDDPPEFIVVSRRFHEVLVDCCGNETLKLVVGTLESLWSAQAIEWGERAVPAGFPDDAYRHHGLDDHESLLRLIEDGDVDGAMRSARDHLEWAPVYSIDEENQIAPNLLRQGRAE
jgi:GntR family transcriptional regulator, transcriptional repressor for pyruvate dehydrogenase complex